MQTLSLADILQKKFIGVDDLRRQLTNILDKLPQEGGEVVITQHGQPKAILTDIDSYLGLLETLEDLSTPGFIDSIHQAVKEVKAGKGLTHEQLIKKLKL